jgi:hypothetical protein
MVRMSWVLTLSYLQGLFTLTSVTSPIVLLLATPGCLLVCCVYSLDSGVSKWLPKSILVLASGFQSGISLRYIGLTYRKDHNPVSTVRPFRSLYYISPISPLFPLSLEPLS